MSAVVWLDEALEDLKSLGNYIAKENAHAAYNILIKIKATADNLSHHPEIGRPGRVFGTREIVMSDLPYIIAYQITNKDIRILAVMHTSRKWPENFNRS
ncbi:MAG: type II toxin-antitoxin system RelE/ParE family toxin [Nitrosomonas sp.]|uniref:type II toxin-antitoxin system RelE/ParE family toxin n=1 Tax=Nitrosomonas sp. TaxID=42353 RepID=UPI0025DDF333|nr:type II toxin-antitoxin system RelE/ParE family toxin [Nitrosomonas sp.]UJP03546.1 MAG: type II toxin-antitoxin system RelE/ParE family toxin [Nitrosomonas sp.]